MFEGLREIMMAKTHRKNVRVRRDDSEWSLKM